MTAQTVTSSPKSLTACVTGPLAYDSDNHRRGEDLMGTTVTLNAGRPQHLEALARANHVRLARARLKEQVASGELNAAEVILTCPWQAKSMAISELLMSQRRWGLKRCRRLLVSLNVPENKRIGTLTERQRVAVAATLRSKLEERTAGASAGPRELSGALSAA